MNCHELVQVYNPEPNNCIFQDIKIEVKVVCRIEPLTNPAIPTCHASGQLYNVGACALAILHMEL